MASGEVAGSSIWPLLTAVIIILIIRGFSSAGGSDFRPLFYFFPIILLGATQLWLNATSTIVPEPYLDEIFHIPQAQKYCEGRFRDWDDKITTPPGLYIISVALPQLFKYLGWVEMTPCDPRALRLTNALGLVFLSYLALLCRQALERGLPRTRALQSFKGSSSYALHTAFNIGLFPLLFFFSGLYYTDVLSTAIVLGAFVNHLQRVSQDTSSAASDLATILIGVTALFMRQTNVFWVVVFMGGLETVHAVKTLRPKRVDHSKATTLWEQLMYYGWRYSVGDIHDLPVSRAYPDDMVFTVVSLAIAAVFNPVRVLRQIWPYITVLGLFAGFVYLNGGVVLGDKSNHVATIHIAQMLYIWPFFAFFSIPLLLPSLLPLPNALLRLINGSAAVPASGNSSSSKDTSAVLKLAVAVFSSKILWPIYLASTVALSGAIVKFNTIIHPFTLADNRHYMFYIFRYTIRRGTLVRMALIAPYTVARWMVWDTLSGSVDWASGDKQSSSTAFDNHPFVISDAASSVHSIAKAATTATRMTSKSNEIPKMAVGEADATHEAVPTSTALMFLLATSLSLVTAPLVEPRYFIIPWVVWRLMVPAWSLPATGVLGYVPGVKQLASLAQGYDIRLVAETVWFILINLVTVYIFLYKGYVWKAEDGTILERGQLQRFMW